MPELPDITIYIEALESRILHSTLERIRLASPFLLRTVDPQMAELENRRVLELKRIGKRIAVQLDGDLWFALHLMIAGRLHWKKGDKTEAEAFWRAARDQYEQLDVTAKVAEMNTLLRQGSPGALASPSRPTQSGKRTTSVFTIR